MAASTTNPIQETPPPASIPGQRETSSSAGDDVSELSILRVIVKHPIIILCCFYANIGSIMYGFDNITLSLCLSMPVFQQQYGTLVGNQYVIPAYWQSLWNALPQLTTGLGAWASGPVADRFGRRTSFFVAGLASVAGVSVVYTASTNGQFLAGKMINAFGLGMALTTGQTYVSEITPLKLRGIALAAYTLGMNIGLIVAASISFKRVTIPNPSAYRLVFAVEFLWPGLLILLLPLIPESPYLLVRKGKADSADKSLRTLYSSSTSTQPILQSIIDTVNHEVYAGESSFRDCFRGINWRRTRIVLYANGVTQMVGATFVANSPYFLIVAGMSPTNSAMVVELGMGLALISSVFTFWAMTFLGNKTLIIGGTAFAGVLFFIMGVAASVPQQSSASLWCVGITLQMGFLTLGPATGPANSIANEVSAVRLRAKTSALGFFFNYFYSTVWNVVVPYMFNADEGNLGGKTGWVFFATSIIAVVIEWFEFPETKNLTYAQIDERFEMRVDARKFKTWNDAVENAKEAELRDLEAESGRKSGA